MFKLIHVLLNSMLQFCFATFQELYFLNILYCPQNDTFYLGVNSTCGSFKLVLRCDLICVKLKLQDFLINLFLFVVLSKEYTRFFVLLAFRFCFPCPLRTLKLSTAFSVFLFRLLRKYIVLNFKTPVFVLLRSR